LEGDGRYTTRPWILTRFRRASRVEEDAKLLFGIVNGLASDGQEGIAAPEAGILEEVHVTSGGVADPSPGCFHAVVLGLMERGTNARLPGYEKWPGKEAWGCVVANWRSVYD